MKNNVSNQNSKFFFSFFLALILSSNVFCLDANNLGELEYSKELNFDEEDERIKIIFLQRAKECYAKADWLNAKYAFHNYLVLADDNDQSKSEILLFYARSCFNAEDYFTAVEVYSDYLDSKTLKLEDVTIAQWERAMASLKVEDTRAKKYMTAIAHDVGHKFKAEAKAILRIL
jgi:hypothetical protein